MENKEKKDEIKVTGGKIDKDVLNIMSQEDILTAISDSKQANRLILNCFCEFLSEIKGLRQDFDEFMQMISVCASDKLCAFFKELQQNVSDETKRLELQDKIKQSHKKSAKKSKKSEK